MGYSIAELPLCVEAAGEEVAKEARVHVSQL
jgi:hypothetical protein